MKSVISAVIIFVLIVIMSIVSSQYVLNTADEILYHVLKNEKSVEQGDWHNAERSVTNIKKIWGSRRKVATFFLNHSVIDSIDASVERQYNSVILREKSAFCFEKNKFVLLIKSLKEQQKISLENIF